jgi:hypothetical protein
VNSNATVGFTTISYYDGSPDDVEVKIGPHVRGASDDNLDDHFVSITRYAADAEAYVNEVTDEELRDELLEARSEQHVVFHTAREYREFLALLLEAGRRAYGVKGALPKDDALVRVRRDKSGFLKNPTVTVEGTEFALPVMSVKFAQEPHDPGRLTLVISGHRVRFQEEDPEGLG